MSFETRIAKARKDAEKAAEEWLKENVPGIEHKVRGILDDNLKQIIAQLLGFKFSWNRLEVDNCNGRKGESAAGDWLRQQAGEAINKWLSEQAGNLPALTPAAVKSLRREYLYALKDGVQDMLIKKAREDAKAEFERIVREAAQ